MLKRVYAEIVLFQSKAMPDHVLAFLRACEPSIRARQRELIESRPNPMEQPVRYFLIEAWLNRVSAVLSGLDSQEWTVPPNQLATELGELEGWLIAKPAEQNNNFSTLGGTIGNLLVSNGCSFTEAQRLLKRFKVGRKGAPPKYRIGTVAALDLRTTRNCTWAKITRLFCGCGRPKHDDLCQDRVRKRVRELEEVLEKYGYVMISGSPAA